MVIIINYYYNLPESRLLHDGNPLDDAVQLDTAMDLQAVIVPFIETRAEEGPKLFEAAASGRVDQAAALI